MAADISSQQDLLTAIANDDVDGMMKVLPTCPASVLDSVGSALHVAAMYSSVACAQRLLADGKVVNLLNKDGYSPLHLASLDGDIEVIQALLMARADLHATTPDARARLMSGALALDATGGRNPLHLAAEKGRLAAAQLLYKECPLLASALDLDGALPRDVALREGARSAALGESRKAIAELLGPGEEIPELEALRRLADEDAKKRRRRLDAIEAAAKAAKDKERLGVPADYGYLPKWPELYFMQAREISACLEPDLAKALSLGPVERAGSLRSLCEEITPGVFAFQMVPGPGQQTQGLNQQLLQEINSVEEWAQQQSAWVLRRPNSMNRYGAVLEDLGLGAFASSLAAIAAPLALALWPSKAFGPLNDVHAFTVRYRSGEDRHLETHTDSSEVTLNICLGGDFTGGGVYFHGTDDADGPPDPMTSPHPADCERCRVTHSHRIGTAIIHLGNHIHGAQNIESGSRTNLILWCRTSERKGAEELPELD